jgi:hypothetical protein
VRPLSSAVPDLLYVHCAYKGASLPSVDSNKKRHAHFIPLNILSHEFGELIAELLLAIKQWCNWQLRYVLSDDSGAEQRAVRLAFPGLAHGEMEVSEPVISLFLIVQLTALRFRTSFVEYTVCVHLSAS